MRERPSASESFAEEDQQFHQLLFRCQNNHMLSALIDMFWVAFYKASDFVNLDNPTPLATWRDHHEIVEAVAASDVDRGPPAPRRPLQRHSASASPRTGCLTNAGRPDKPREEHHEHQDHASAIWRSPALLLGAPAGRPASRRRTPRPSPAASTSARAASKATSTRWPRPAASPGSAPISSRW